MTFKDESRLLRDSLLLAVPLRMASQARWSDEERAEAAHRAAQIVAEHGDILMYGGSRKGEAAKAFAALAEGLAAAAYQPGGVRFAGMHWCVDHDACLAAEAEAAAFPELQERSAPAGRPVEDVPLSGGVL